MKVNIILYFFIRIFLVVITGLIFKVIRCTKNKKNSIVSMVLLLPVYKKRFSIIANII